MFIIHNLTLNKPIIPISRKVFPASFWCFERVNLLEPSISLVGKFSARQAQVNGNHQALKEKGMDVTPRELSILAVAVTILQQRGTDPFQQRIIIQVDNTSVVSLSIL